MILKEIDCVLSGMVCSGFCSFGLFVLVMGYMCFLRGFGRYVLSDLDVTHACLWVGFRCRFEVQSSSSAV